MVLDGFYVSPGDLLQLTSARHHQPVIVSPHVNKSPQPPFQRQYQNYATGDGQPKRVVSKPNAESEDE